MSFLAACLLLAPLTGRARESLMSDTSRPAHLIRLADGRRINLRCAGPNKGPTVLLEGGFGAPSTAWYKVAPLIDQRHRVCAYDRAGYGFSDQGPMPRDGAAVVRDLNETLKIAGIAAPFVVVGHSAGALYVRLFADSRPRDVVGMVLVDPSVEHQDARFAAVFGKGLGGISPLRARAAACLAAANKGALPSVDPALVACGPRPGANPAEAAQARSPGTWQTQVSELDTLFTLTSDEVDAGRQGYGDMPLIVLTADGSYARAPAAARAALDGVWSQLHAEISARSTRGSAQRVAHSSHMMIFDRPDAIAAAVEEVIAAAR
jgi:pimeloyl-ACP methyl ester carboxylesterase